MADERKRDLVLAPGQYVFMQDAGKGSVKVYSGPITVNQTPQDIPVVYDPASDSFSPCDSLDKAVRKSPLADENSYIVLTNPAAKGEHPEESSQRQSPSLELGRKVNVPGPATFSLWPWQSAKVIKGHQIRSNQYLLVRVYNVDEATKNWVAAIVRGPDGKPVPPTAAPELNVGQLLIIKGTEASFFLPPTGLEVVPEDDGNYVRDALTLERLEYCILVSEGGQKRYERGPKVVFPEPTETFIQNDGRRKFRAMELNEIQGIHIKVIADYAEDGKEYKAGDEIFVTGKEQSIYFPREEHSLVSYDGRSKHFATAIPSGNARYVMHRKTGAIRMVAGPAMLLPNPVDEVVVRRILTDNECATWYPGNIEALEYNRALREVAKNAPTTRQGMVSDGDANRGLAKGGKRQFMSNDASVMERSSVTNAAPAMVADEFTRASTYTQPRSITIEGKYEGAPQINIWTGFAVQVVNSKGDRRVEVGPRKLLLDYDETLEVMELSTGKPKNTDTLLKTVYLRVLNNKVSDVISVETRDHVETQIRLSYSVNFEGDSSKWFASDNYIKLLADHIRSLLKGSIRKATIGEFYAKSTDIVRDFILGASTPEGRKGQVFTQNNMRVTDVDVLGVELKDNRIAGLLQQAQHEVIQQNIELERAQRSLEATIKREDITRQTADAQHNTAKHKASLEAEKVEVELGLTLSRIASAMKQNEEAVKSEQLQQAVQDVQFDGDLARSKRQADAQAAINQDQQNRAIAMIQAEAEAMKQKFSTLAPGFTEALLAVSNNHTLAQIAEASSAQRLFGGTDVVDVLSKAFAGHPLQVVLDRIARKASAPIEALNGNGNKQIPTSA